jgi:5-methyltetrahydrofolate--homocysteine methyltransferase
MIIIGERLNSSRRNVHRALVRRNDKFLLREAKLQQQAGAAYIDFNASALAEKEIETLRWAIPFLQRTLEIPLSLDTAHPEAMEEALKLHRGRALLNSLAGEEKRIQSLLPLIKSYQPRVIVLCLDDKGLPDKPERALSIAQRMVELLVKQGLKAEDIFVDPLVRSRGADWRAGALFLESLERIKKHLPGIKTIAGVSNVSFGLPRRKLLNRTMLVLALEAGLDAAICDPLDKELQASLAASEALLGQDPSLKNYLQFMRRQTRKKKS